MKKLLLLGIFSLAGITANAQLAPGSPAPDFTATDTNGVQHHLQEYLDQGKTVIMDVSATWCGPCWNFHTKHVLEDLHNAYGPEGSGEVVVLFIEGDSTTGMNDLLGETSSSQGNWLAGTSYPVIDSGSIANSYSIAYFPTLYRICPSGQVYEMSTGVNSAAELMTAIGQCGAVTGIQNHAKVHKSDVRLCEANELSNIEVELTNYGTNAISEAMVSLKQNGTTVATANFTGSLAQYQSDMVSFEEVSVDASSDYTVEIEEINTAAPSESSTNTNDVTFSIANQAENNFIAVLVHTDNYPGEISWDIKDSNGSVVASGGPYQPGTQDQFGGGGPDANTTKMHLVEITEGLADCMTVNLYDSYGDGWIYGSTTHGMQIYSNDDLIFNMNVGNFGEMLSQGSAFKTNGVLGTDTVETSKFAVYPNPSNGIFNFSTQENVAVTITDLTGKTVFTATEIGNGDSINLSSLQKGMYIAKIVGENSERTEKLIIK